MNCNRSIHRSLWPALVVLGLVATTSGCAEQSEKASTRFAAPHVQAAFIKKLDELGISYELGPDGEVRYRLRDAEAVAAVERAVLQEIAPPCSVSVADQAEAQDTLRALAEAGISGRISPDVIPNSLRVSWVQTRCGEGEAAIARSGARRLEQYIANDYSRHLAPFERLVIEAVQARVPPHDAARLSEVLAGVDLIKRRDRGRAVLIRLHPGHADPAAAQRAPRIARFRVNGPEGTANSGEIRLGGDGLVMLFDNPSEYARPDEVRSLEVHVDSVESVNAPP